MARMQTIKEVAHTTGMSEYAVRKGILAGLYPGLRATGNSKGKILVNIDEFIATLNTIAHRNMSMNEADPTIQLANTIRRIEE